MSGLEFKLANMQQRRGGTLKDSGSSREKRKFSCEYEDSARIGKRRTFCLLTINRNQA